MLGDDMLTWVCIAGVGLMAMAIGQLLIATTRQQRQIRQLQEALAQSHVPQCSRGYTEPATTPESQR